MWRESTCPSRYPVRSPSGGKRYDEILRPTLAGVTLALCQRLSTERLSRVGTHRWCTQRNFPIRTARCAVPRVVDLLKKSGVEVWIEQRRGPRSRLHRRGLHRARARMSRTPMKSASRRGFCCTCASRNSAGLARRHRHRLLRSFDRSRRSPRATRKPASRLFSMEFIPRITRAQSMDALSSMASIAGYKAVLLAANTLPRLFPMMTTAAGTMPPARVLVIGRRRRRVAGDRHRAASGRGGQRLRCARRGEGTDRKPGREVRQYRHRGARARAKAAMRARSTKRPSGVSASRWRW